VEKKLTLWENIHTELQQNQKTLQNLKIIYNNATLALYLWGPLSLHLVVVLSCQQFMLGRLVEGVLGLLEVDDQVEYRPQLRQDALGWWR